MKLDETNVGGYADTLVLQVRGGGRDLDYRPESLTVVEELLRMSDELLQGENLPDTQRNLVVFYNGCYVGEVLARQLGGVWRFAENWFDASLVFPFGDGGLQTFPFRKVHRRVTDGPDGNDLATYYAALAAKLAEDPPARTP